MVGGGGGVKMSKMILHRLWMTSDPMFQSCDVIHKCILSVCTSGYIKPNTLQNNYLSIHFQVINKMVDQYGGQWPPRPSFKGWPPCWKVYEEIADKMREVCDGMNNVDNFRSWMHQQLDEKVQCFPKMK